MILAYTAGTWTQVIVALSIFVPVVITIVLCVVFLKGSKNDPDRTRLRQAQSDYETQRDRQGHPRR